jgi:hypothetical protein
MYILVTPPLLRIGDGWDAGRFERLFRVAAREPQPTQSL